MTAGQVAGPGQFPDDADGYAPALIRRPEEARMR